MFTTVFRRSVFAGKEVLRYGVARANLDWFPSLIKLHFRYAYNVW